VLWHTSRNKRCGRQRSDVLRLPQREEGFTLIEIMAALTIFALMGVVVFSVVFDASKRSRVIDREVKLQMAAGAILDLVTEDLKGTYIKSGEFPFLLGEDVWQGDDQADTVQLITTSSMPVSPFVPNGGLSEVGYSLSFPDGGGLGTLFRREQFPPDLPDDEGGNTFAVSGKVRSFNVRYYDGDSWWDLWDSLDENKPSMKGFIPREIEVELVLEDAGSQVTARTRVAPPLAGGL